MSRLTASAFLVTIVYSAGAVAQIGEPPATEVRTVTDTVQGVEIRDDYRWLEGDDKGNMTDELGQWTDAQNDYTRKALDSIPGRAELESRLRELMEIPLVSAPTMYGEMYFYNRREGSMPQSLICARHGLDGDEMILLDPQQIDESGLTTVAWTAPNPDGSLMAFGMYRAGDENSTLYIMDVHSGEWLAEEIPGKVQFDEWLPDSSGFYYSALEDTDDAYSGVSRYHKLGTHHRQDRTLFRQHDLATFYGDMGYSDEKLKQLSTTWGPWITPSDDNRWAFVGYWTGTSSFDLWTTDLAHWFETGELKLVPAAIGMSGRPGSVNFEGDTVYMETTLGAPNGRVVAINLHHPEYENWKDIIPEDPKLVLDSVSYADGIIAADYLDAAKTRISLYDNAGQSLGELALPGIGSAGLSTKDDRTEAFLTFTSYNMPTSIYHMDLAHADAEPDLWARPDVPVDPDSVEVKQVWYESKDGTPVSMFIVHPKGLELNGDNPTILYGYGGFNISMTPGFSATMFPWFEAGGVYAVANLRGGGEYGSAWHEDGMLDKKQNVFDDFIAAAEYLVENKYTNPKRLGIAGGSNGGLLTGAVLAQRPDLFAAVECHVPLLDMLRYQDFLMARYWVPEYGSAEDAEQFKTLIAYSPYHNIHKGVEYPATLLTAGENDTRVHPMHARKMAALMQASTAASPSEKPVLLWVDREAGHGGGKSLDQRVRDIADRRIFMMRQLGMIEE
ncbi:MAG: S9 family peptidase [Phycisphaera sp.]|nr:S9 family peptidase [Phycisphaera sp.]